MRVNEIFHSIQGESTFAGWPCAFVRLTGCNLRCSFCDTRYAYEEGTELSIDEIRERIEQLGCNLVEITGGEPLIQPDTPELVGRLIDGGYKVLVETNGSRDISVLDNRCVRIVDFKCPSSGESGANDLENIRRLQSRDEIKLVIGDRTDYEFSAKLTELIRTRSQHGCAIHFSPVFGRLAPDTLAEWILADRLKVRLNLQLHKLIWDPNRRGV